MVRPGSIAIALLLAACSGEIQSDNLEGLPPAEQFALQTWEEKAYPVLSAKCVMCHDGSMPMIGYLAGATDVEKRDTLVNYMPAVVNLGAPQSSRILTKGVHTGPALEAKEATDILTWILTERDARPEIQPIRTAQLTAMLCTTAPCPNNSLDLTPLGFPGSVDFEVTQLSADLYMTNIKLKAGAMGIYAAHPLFESWPAGVTTPKPDPIDRWFNVVINLAPNTEMTIGTGEGSFSGFGAADPLSMRFDIIDKQHTM